MRTRLRCLIVLCVLLLPALARAQGITTGPIDEVLGRSGQKTGDVYKVGFPRSDLQIKPTETPPAEASIAARKPAPPAPMTRTSCSRVW